MIAKIGGGAGWQIIFTVVFTILLESSIMEIISCSQTQSGVERIWFRSLAHVLDYLWLSTCVRSWNKALSPPYQCLGHYSRVYTTFTLWVLDVIHIHLYVQPNPNLPSSYHQKQRSLPGSKARLHSCSTVAFVKLYLWNSRCVALPS